MLENDRRTCGKILLQLLPEGVLPDGVFLDHRPRQHSQREADVMHRQHQIDSSSFDRRGKIKVLDRARLEAAWCECYEVVKKEYERLLG